jgi:hypothetical protein
VFRFYLPMKEAYPRIHDILWSEQTPPFDFARLIDKDVYLSMQQRSKGLLSLYSRLHQGLGQPIPELPSAGIIYAVQTPRLIKSSPIHPARVPRVIFTFRPWGSQCTCLACAGGTGREVQAGATGVRSKRQYQPEADPEKESKNAAPRTECRRIEEPEDNLAIAAL